MSAGSSPGPGPTPEPTRRVVEAATLAGPASAEPAASAAPVAPVETVAPTEPATPAADTARATRRPPRGRVSPQALAEARGGALEGLAWLGRTPEARASWLYRAFRLLVRSVAFGLLHFRIATSGQEHLPGGGFLLVAAAHRGWMDPFVVVHALPLEPRAWFLGSAPSTFTARWREVLVHRLGGLLPVWRGGIGVDQHVASARAVIANGAIFVQMPEGTVSGPPGRLGVMRPGWAIIAMRTDAPIVPLAIAGTEELYLGRRMASRVLPPTTVRELAGLPAGAPLPEPGSREELDLARRLTEALTARLGPVVESLHPQTIDPPDHPRRFRGRLTWLLLRPGRLDREG